MTSDVPSGRSRRSLGAVLILSSLVIGFGCFITGMYAFAGVPWLGLALAFTAIGAAVVGALLVFVSFGARGDTDDGPVAEESLAEESVSEARPLGRGQRVLLGLAASLALLLVVALGVIDGLVWMPQALVPGTPVPEIHARMDVAGELASALVSLGVWAVFWSIAALVPVILSLTPLGARVLPRRSAVLLLALVLASAAIFFQWMGTFSMGMGVADTFAVGGGQSPFWAFYSLLGQTALIGVIVLALRPGSMARPTPLLPDRLAA